MSSEEQGTMPLAMALSQRLGISVSSEEAETLHENILQMMTAAVREGSIHGATQERARICAAIKEEDDYCVDNGDYMLDSDDCIKIALGTWTRPDFSVEGGKA